MKSGKQLQAFNQGMVQWPIPSKQNTTFWNVVHWCK